MKNIKYAALFFAIILIGLCSCENEKENNNIKITAQIPQNMKVGTQDTLWFTVISNVPIIRVSLKKDTLYYASISEDIIGKNNTVFYANFVYKPVKTGIETLEFFAINIDYDTKSYPFSIEVTQ